MILTLLIRLVFPLKFANEKNSDVCSQWILMDRNTREVNDGNKKVVARQKSYYFSLIHVNHLCTYKQFYKIS